MELWNIPQRRTESFLLIVFLVSGVIYCMFTKMIQVYLYDISWRAYLKSSIVRDKNEERSRSDPSVIHGYCSSEKREVSQTKKK